MFNDTWSSSSSSTPPAYSDKLGKNFLILLPSVNIGQWWWFLAAASFLVSVPVFVQAPLVRLFPLLSLLMTAVWWGLGWILLKRPKTQLWGDLLLGFSWSWLAGSIYWGWFRSEPLIHLPIEAIGFPFAIWFFLQNKRLAANSNEATAVAVTDKRLSYLLLRGEVGNLFYLGSLFGTAITDLYFYVVGLIPYWREIMKVDPTLATPILQDAIAQVRTPWGGIWAVVLVTLLLSVGLTSLRKKEAHWWAFGGAVLSTILVDGLFWVVASLA